MPTPPLQHLTDHPAPPRWAWAVGHPEDGGRVRLPAEAKAALGCIDAHRLLVRGRCHRIGLVLRVDASAGAALKIDGAGRLMLPTWLRDVGPLVIGTDTAAGVVVVAPVVVLRPGRRPPGPRPPMTVDRTLRARLILDEAHALGLDLADLVAADATAARQLVTVAQFLETTAPSFGASTARTYRPYWRLLVARLGDARLADITVADLTLVVADAVARARRTHPDTTGRAPRETCVAALRAVFSRAHAAGLITSNPAAALVKPRRGRSRRRALDEDELADLIDAVRTTSRDPDLDLLLVRFHLETGARRQGAHLHPESRGSIARSRGDKFEVVAESRQPVDPLRKRTFLSVAMRRSSRVAGRCVSGTDGFEMVQSILVRGALPLRPPSTLGR